MGSSTVKDAVTGSFINNNLKTLLSEYFPWVLVAVLYLCAGVFFPELFTIDQFESILTQATPVIILSIGMAFTLIVGEIDLSIVSILLFAPLMGLYAVQWFGVPGIVGLVVTVLVGLVIGAFNGVFITKVGVPSLIQTLASWWILEGVVLSLTRGQSLANFPSVYQTIGIGSLGPIRYLLIIMFVVSMIAWYYSTKVVDGRRLFLVGGDPGAGSRMGLSVSKYKMHAFLISGMFAAIGGLALITWVGTLSTGTGTDLLLPAIAAPVIAGIPLTGGAGKIINVPAGALLVQTILTITRVAGISSYEFQLVQGLLVFVAVILNEVRKRGLVELYLIRGV